MRVFHDLRPRRLGPGGFALAACALLGLPACTPDVPAALAADLVLVNGHVITVDELDSEAQAVAIRAGRIVAVGSDAAVERLIGPGPERIDLDGLTATPGLLDVHAHFSGGGADRLFVSDLSYPRVKSIADVVSIVAEQVSQLGPDAWVQGRGWDEGKLAENRLIQATDLDSVSPNNPVVLTQTMGHYLVANSVALTMAGITAETPDPPNGTIDRDASGQPTGVLKESAQGLVQRLVPDLTPEQVRAGIADLAKAFNAEGMTGVKDPGIGPEAWAAYQKVLADGDLTVRVFVLWHTARSVEDAEALIARIGPFTKPYISTGDDHLVSGGIKMYMDGSGGARTAWMYDEWNKNLNEVDAGNHGYPAMDPELLRRLVDMYTAAGLHVSIHSIGDRAIDWTVDSYAAALERHPMKGLRDGVIHANIPTDHALDVMARLQRDYDAGYPESSPGFAWWIGDTYAGNFGPVRNARLNPYHTFVDKGIRWASGSDFGVTPFAARYGIWAAVARETALGVWGATPFGTAESVDVRTALRSYTIWAAHQMFLEDEIGSIEVGKYADIAVWDRDPYTVPTAELEEMRCEMTLFQGRVVYRNAEGPLAASR